MVFAILIFLTAFFIEGIGTYISILGLSALFAFNPIIIAMAVALDLGKVVAVSFLYRAWDKINLFMKTYMTLAAIVLILITSTGVFGFLSGEFQKAMAGNSQQTLIIRSLQEERDRLLKRKEQIDNQIATLPEKFTANQRIRMIAQLKDEQKAVTSRIAEIDKKLPELKIQSIEKEVKIGPIIYVAEAFNTTPESAAKWVIMIIIFVFDPLAIALILAANYLWANRKSGNDQLVAPSSEPAPPTSLENFYQPEPVVVSRQRRKRQSKKQQEIISSENRMRSGEAGESSPNLKVTTAEIDESITEHVAIKSSAELASNDQSAAINQKVPENLPRVKSLEGIDPRSSDVLIDDDPRHHHQISGIMDKYKSEFALSNNQAVSVGGPPTKI